jgi:hypothetical protein
MFNLKPSENLSSTQIQSGQTLVVKDGLIVEVMATLTSGAFLVAMALKFGATNFQIGLLAALPTISNVFQVFALFLVNKFANRKIVTVLCSLFARIPVLIIAALPFIFPAATSLKILMVLLFVHHLFSAMSAASWHSWMKDLLPIESLGNYFARRNRLIQIVSVVLSLAVAFILDIVKSGYANYELDTYSIMFIVGGVFGLIGVILLGKTPEPQMKATASKNVFKSLRKPFRDPNYKRVLVFRFLYSVLSGHLQ